MTCDGLISTTIVTAAGPSGLTLGRIQGDRVVAGIRVIEG